MNTKHIKHFYESLPSHLQAIFNESVKNQVPINSFVQLKGYRGPEFYCNGSCEDSAETQAFPDGLLIIRHKWKLWHVSNSKSNVSALLTMGLTATALTAARYGTAATIGLPVAIGTTAVSASASFVLNRYGDRIENKWCYLIFDEKDGRLLSHDIADVPGKLNEKGRERFYEGSFVSAKEYHENACALDDQPEYQSNLKSAEAEIKAEKLDKLGDELFEHGDFNGALELYKEAFTESYVCCSNYDIKIDRAQNEIEAVDLYSSACKLYEKGDFKAAKERYYLAFVKSQVEKQKDLYTNHLLKMNALVEGIETLNSKWKAAWLIECEDREFRSLAKPNFEEVLQKSKEFSSGYPDVVKFRQFSDMDGDNLFLEGCDSHKKAVELADAEKWDLACYNFERADLKFSSSIAKFETGSALNDSFYQYIDRIRSVIASKRNGERDNLIQNILKLQVLWKKAWNAEKDSETDKSDLVNYNFKNVFMMSKEFSEKYPKISTFRDLKNLVTLKIDGNESFNEGLVLQKTAMQLYKSRKLDLAQAMLKEAKSMFEKSKHKFEEGAEISDIFATSVEEVQKQLNFLEEQLLMNNFQKLTAASSKNGITEQQPATSNKSQVTKDDGNYLHHF